MTLSAVGLAVRAVLIVGLCVLLGLAGLVDPVHCVLIGCLLFALVLLGARRGEGFEGEWPTRPAESRAGGRASVSDLSWKVFDHEQLVSEQVVRRVRQLAIGRLAQVGIDAHDQAQWPEVERRLGRSVAAGLAAPRRPSPRALWQWLDSIEKLSNERSTT